MGSTHGVNAWGQRMGLTEGSIDAGVDPFTNALAVYQLIKDREHLFPVEVDLLEFFAHGEFIAVPSQQLVQQLSGNVDVAAQSFGRMPAQEEAVEKSRFALRSQRVDLLLERHNRDC
jgi:hypothetical protein